MVIVAVLGLGNLGGNIVGELAFNCQTVRAWDKNQDALDKLNSRIEHEKKNLKSDNLMSHSDFLGNIYCFSQLEEATLNADLIIEAIEENLEAKQDLLNTVSHHVKPKAIIATSSLGLHVDKVFSMSAYKERCLGMRFLHPVYCIPEVELRPGKLTNLTALEYCTSFLERIGKTAYYRSGDEPLILTETQRNERRKERMRMAKTNKRLGGKTKYLLPELAHRGNFAPPQDDATSVKPSPLDNECVICMDSMRTCVLAPCHHLCTCSECGDMLVCRKDACPICRRTITNVIRFYRA